MYESRLLRILDRCYGWIITLGSNFQSLFLLYMRLVWGHQFFLSGMGKFASMETVVKFFGSLGLSHPEFVAYAVAFFESVGGICIFVGFVSRLMAIPLIVIMISALSLAHSEAFIQLRFLFEPAMLVRQAPYPFLITSFLVLFWGPGKISVDGWLKRWASNQPKY